MFAKCLILLVGRAGFGPTANGLKVRCSTSLSYRPLMEIKDLFNDYNLKPDFSKLWQVII